MLLSKRLGFISIHDFCWNQDKFRKIDGSINYQGTVYETVGNGNAGRITLKLFKDLSQVTIKLH
jgi:hypothetical protein